MNVEIFALYIFSRYSRFSNIRENTYNLNKILVLCHRDINIKSANSNPREIANFRKFAKIYTRENIYIHSICDKLTKMCCLLSTFLIEQASLPSIWEHTVPLLLTTHFNRVRNVSAALPETRRGHVLFSYFQNFLKIMKGFSSMIFQYK